MSSSLHAALETLFREFVHGPPGAEAYMLNAGDVGLLRSLDTLSAAAASATPPSGGASIAAHVDHLRYGLSLMNRWAAGDPNPFATADWTTSWTRTRVSDQEWAALRKALADETHTWAAALRTPREYKQIELNGIIGSIAHLGYHLGAIRQIDRSMRGPAAS
jgi:DinB family protein